MTTLLRHSAVYLLARGLPGLINFLSIAVYTRLLSPDEYGRYALVVAGVGLFNVVFFSWLRLSLLRFLPSTSSPPHRLLSTLLAAFLAVASLTGACGIIMAILWKDPSWRSMILLGLALLWAQAWFELNIEIYRSRLQPTRYGAASLLRTVLALITGTALVIWKSNAFAPLTGLLIGFTITGFIITRNEWKGVRPKIDGDTAKHVLSYGLPLTGTFALSFVTSTSDRFLIAHFLGERSAGIYAAGYDAVNQLLVMLMMIVNMAAYPLVVKAMEQQGFHAAQNALTKSGLLLLSVALPSMVTLIVMAPQFAALLGSSFRETISFLPYIAVGAFLNGLRSYHFDLAFQLSRTTIGQMWVAGIAGLVNFGLNLFWIPRYGLLGAAWSTVTAYALALVLSILLGRRIFHVPFSWWGAARILLAVLAMAFTIKMLPFRHGISGGLLQVLLGSCVYGAIMFSLHRRSLFHLPKPSEGSR